jgi:hypothetical protein
MRWYHGETSTSSAINTDEVFSFLEVIMNNIEFDGIPDYWRHRDRPTSWAPQPSFSLRIFWLGKTPNEGALEMAQMQAESWREKGDVERAEAVLLGVPGHPGWWMHGSVFMGYADSLEAAVKLMERELTNSDFRIREFFSRDGGERPVKPFKQQRKQLIEQMRSPSAQGDSNNSVLVHEAFLEINADYAVQAWIEDVSAPPELQTLFGDEDNPLRSLETVWCIVDFTGPDEGNEEAMAGYCSVEGNTVRVGEWSREFSPEAEVEGAPFGDVSAHASAEGRWYHFTPFTKPVSIEEFRQRMLTIEDEDVEEDEEA